MGLGGGVDLRDGHRSNWRTDGRFLREEYCSAIVRVRRLPREGERVLWAIHRLRSARPRILHRRNLHFARISTRRSSV